MLFSETEAIEVSFEGKSYTMREDGLLYVSWGCTCEDMNWCIKHQYEDCIECDEDLDYPVCNCPPYGSDVLTLIPGSELDLSLAKAGHLTHVERDVAYWYTDEHKKIESWHQVSNISVEVLWNGQLKAARTLDLTGQLGRYEMPEKLNIRSIHYVDMRAPRITTAELETILAGSRLQGNYGFIALEEAPEYTVFCWKDGNAYGFLLQHVTQLSKGVWVLI